MATESVSFVETQLLDLVGGSNLRLHEWLQLICCIITPPYSLICSSPTEWLKKKGFSWRIGQCSKSFHSHPKFNLLLKNATGVDRNMRTNQSRIENSKHTKQSFSTSIQFLSQHALAVKHKSKCKFIPSNSFCISLYRYRGVKGASASDPQFACHTVTDLCGSLGSQSGLAPSEMPTTKRFQSAAVRCLNTATTIRSCFVRGSTQRTSS